MHNIAQTLIEIAKSIEPEEGYFGYFNLVDALEADPRAFERFKSAIASASAADLDSVEDTDEKYGWIVMGAADALDLLPDDPRLFAPAEVTDSLPAEKVLQALCSACILNDVATVSRLVNRIDLNSLDHNKQTALCYAVGNNHLECVRVLLAHGASPDRVQNWGNTAMHVCATSRSSKEIFRMLVAAGGDVTMTNDDGLTVEELLKQFRRRNWMTR